MLESLYLLERIEREFRVRALRAIGVLGTRSSCRMTGEATASLFIITMVVWSLTEVVCRARDYVHLPFAGVIFTGGVAEGAEVLVVVDLDFNN